MAKTRIKTTPTRSAALTAEDIKKRLRLVNAGTAPGKETINVTSNIMVPAPKRTNSISSATSSVSMASDTPSLHSEADFMVIPQNATTTTQIIATTNASTTSNVEEKPPQQSTPKTLNLQLGRQNMATLKNRKVFMITERCDDVQLENNGGDNNHQTASAQKRKMYLVMEETPAKNGNNYSVATKSFKNNVGVGNPTKKLTLYTDKCDTALLTHKFEQILPEILNRINNNNHNNSNSNKRPSTISTVIAQQALAKKIKQNGPTPITDQYQQLQPTQQELPPLNLTADTTRSPITLPPKKNRMKIINNANAAAGNNFCAATPVIMSTMNLELSTVEATPPLATTPPPPPVLMSQSQKNINLSADFLFLMKMLPQLEAIPEPHKSYVKSCIEKIVSQNSELCDEP